jgi:hypothetical protein
MEAGSPPGGREVGSGSATEDFLAPAVAAGVPEEESVVVVPSTAG